eukprot:179521-Ditylum_brightwellii.AAC.3
MNSSSAKHHRLTEHQLCCYLGNRSLSSIKEIEAIAQENLIIVNTGEIPVEIGDMAKIQGSQRSNQPIEPPPTTFHTMHADIGYGNSTAPGGIKYILILVGQKQRNKAAFQTFQTEAGTLPLNLYTHFDKKIIKGDCKEYLRVNEVRVAAAPSGRQSQNGLVERTWQTICNMGGAYLTDMQIPKCFWFWALRHAAQVHNYMSRKLNGYLTSSFKIDTSHTQRIRKEKEQQWNPNHFKG